MLSPADVEAVKQSFDFDVKIIESLLPANHRNHGLLRVPELRKEFVKTVTDELNPKVVAFVERGCKDILTGNQLPTGRRVETRLTLAPETQRLLKDFLEQTYAKAGKSPDRWVFRRALRHLGIIVEQVMARTRIAKMLVR